MAILSDLHLSNALDKKHKFKYGSSAGRDEHGYSLRIANIMVPEYDVDSIKDSASLGYGVPKQFVEALGKGMIYKPKEVNCQRYALTMEDGEDVTFFLIPPDSPFAIVTEEIVDYPLGVYGTLHNKSSFPVNLKFALVDGGFNGALTLRGRNPEQHAWLILAQGTGCAVLLQHDDPNQTVGYESSDYSKAKRYD